LSRSTCTRDLRLITVPFASVPVSASYNATMTAVGIKLIIILYNSGNGNVRALRDQRSPPRFSACAPSCQIRRLQQSKDQTMS
jgi:hypothetical protein